MIGVLEACPPPANLCPMLAGWRIAKPDGLITCLQAWLAIREANPAARGCYLHSDETRIISNSPELFLEFNPGNRKVHSIPIKGTAPVTEGEAGRQRLVDSPKEQA